MFCYIDLELQDKDIFHWCPVLFLLSLCVFQVCWSSPLSPESVSNELQCAAAQKGFKATITLLFQQRLPV